MALTGTRNNEPVDGARRESITAAIADAADNLLLEIRGGLYALAHSLFWRTRERWLSDILRNRDYIRRWKGALLLFAPVSGEVITGLPLLRLLSERWPGTPVLVCATTKSGLAAARSAGLEAARLAVDSRRLARGIVKALEPRGMIMIQASCTGLPVNLIAALAAGSRPVVVVNGSVTQRDLRASRDGKRRRLGVYGNITAFCMQTEKDAERLITLGADPEKIHVVGNMKMDAAIEDAKLGASEDLRRELHLNGSEALIVAGSTHPGEEEAVLEGFRAVERAVPEARLILAPRKIKRAKSILQTCRQAGFSAELRSSLRSCPQIIVLDTMGELRLLYESAAVAFVGGTLVPVGGHNVLEPAARGKPVLFGPYVHNTSGAAEALLEAGGAFKVCDADDLSRTLVALFDDDNARRGAGARALEAVRSHVGAAALYAKKVEELVDPAEVYSAR
ncbi:MAG: glycosyltransferase N-terminal domain-containing protein [Armatimonadota bacterium]|nr:glycosyltransferase N-terminal domain-containing protein [Armatimonadota bacterium]